MNRPPTCSVDGLYGLQIVARKIQQVQLKFMHCMGISALGLDTPGHILTLSNLLFIRFIYDLFVINNKVLQSVSNQEIISILFYIVIINVIYIFW